MNRFAHMADIHLGACGEPILQKLEAKVFNDAMDKCVELGVDFILISGDLFHVGIPDLSVVNKAVRKMREVQLAGIPIYVIYGSHDYTPTGTSIIDILDSAGILTKIVKWRREDGKLILDFFTDSKTGAKLAGISARKIGLESKNYEQLDKERLEREDGFKIFAFHSGLSEFKPAFLSEMETITVSYLPKGFDYYAGGHIHERGEFRLPGYEKVVFPGPLFTGHGNGKDIESTVRGAKRGFYVVDFDDEVRELEFVEVNTFGGAYFEYDAGGKNSSQAGKELERRLEGLEVKGKVVVLKVKGELTGGRTSDIDFGGFRTKLIENGALYVYLNRHGLTSKEFAAVQVMGEDIPAIEAKLLRENIGAVKISQLSLKDSSGASLAGELLRALRQEAKANESKKEYLERMIESGVEILKLGELLG